MITKKTTIINETGLHARPATEFVNLAKSFDCTVQVRNVTRNEEFVNAKSILMVLTQELCKGNEVEILVDGENEEVIANQIIELIDSGFGE